MSTSSLTIEQLLSQTSWAERLARRLADSKTDAEDLLQDGWVAALHARPSPRDGLRPWLSEVLRNAASNRHRTDRRRQARDTAAGAFASTATVASPEELVGRMETQRLLAELVLGLDPPVRDVVLLRFYEGLSSADISRATGAPEGTVRWRLKTGIDELRRRLDERHGGRREDWLRGMVPFVSAGGTPGRANSGGRPVASAKLASPLLLTGTAALLVTLGLVLGRGGRETVTADSAGDQGLPGTAGLETPPGSTANAPGSGGAPNLLAAASAPGDLDSCRRRLTAVRAEIAKHEPEYIATARPITLFESGSPNPEAEGVLTPLLARLMKGDAGVAPDHALECRTWACRLKVLAPREQNADFWMLPLQRDPDMRERTRTVHFASGSPVKDPVSGATFYEKSVYLKLADPSAKRIPHVMGPGAGPWRPIVVASSVEIPRSLVACRADFTAAEQRLMAMKTIIERDAPLTSRFAREQVNRELTAEIDTLVRTILDLPSPSRGVGVECRSRICRLTVDRQVFPDLNVFSRRLNTPAWRSRTEQGLVGGGVNYHVIAPKDAALGGKVASAIHKELLASSAFEACEARHAPTGQIEIQLEVPRTGERNQDGQIGKISTRMGGSLSGTPFGRCVEAALADVVARTPVPPKVTGAALYRTTNFPRPASAPPSSAR